MRDVSCGLRVIHSAMVDEFEQRIRSNAITPELVRLVNVPKVMAKMDIFTH